MTFNYDFKYAYYSITSSNDGGITITDLLRVYMYLLFSQKLLNTNFMSLLHFSIFFLDLKKTRLLSNST